MRGGFFRLAVLEFPIIPKLPKKRAVSGRGLKNHGRGGGPRPFPELRARPTARLDPSPSARRSPLAAVRFSGRPSRSPAVRRAVDLSALAQYSDSLFVRLASEA